MYSRPTYSPSSPRQSNCTAPTAATATNVEVQPGTVRPFSQASIARASSSPVAAAPPRPNQVASRSGATENPVRLSTDNRIIRDNGYFVRPAARDSRR